MRVNEALVSMQTYRSLIVYTLKGVAAKGGVTSGCIGVLEAYNGDLVCYLYRGA